MSHTHTRLLYHIVYSTKRRTKWITPAVKAELYPYLCSLVEKHRGHPYKINGMAEHVHIVCQLRSEPSVARILKDLKAYSSGWLKRRFRLKQFGWQEGYAAFTVSPSQLRNVITYVENQEEHHRRRTFEEEYKELLRKHGIEFDPKQLFVEE